ncbi:RHS repeat-associated core domain-containing protein, partial [Burkholderia stagnalis]|uniref:RHS repeat-associated core domain-containing protein n=1 Tax=Burkholderia stagnalis TaxID=1503054 RepID=UPI000B16D568
GKVMERRYHYDAAGQLTQIADMRRGQIQYAYDPIGRLTRAQSSLGVETFAFDPASNIVEATERDVHGIGVLGGEPAVPLLDNLLKEYTSTHYTYDEQGNLKERRRNGERMVFGWSSLGRMVTASDRHMQARYVYDALGRRIAKLTEPQVPHLSSAGSGWRDAERRRLKQEYGYGLTLYGWDGDTLAYETSWDKRETTHYVYEPGGFTPLVRATGAAALRDDGDAVAELTSIAYYHCDQIGTPQEVTDEAGEIAWSARYKAWGEAREVIGEAARKAGIVNPLRFAGQYFDRETGLHYNRHRYYDPNTGRFISKDPIGLQGGINVFQYAPNPISWIDPLGLTSKTPPACGCLDWSRTNPRTGETAPEHVMRHGEDIPKRQVPHGVFADDPIATTNAAWDKAVQQRVSPTVGPNGNLVYDIPYPEAGLQGGIPGAAAGHPILDSVRIVTGPGGANKVVTSFPK